MRWGLVGGAVGAAVTVRVIRARWRRILHPRGRSFTGDLEVWGLNGDGPLGADLIDEAGRHPVTVRISKGAGTPGGWPDVRGLAIRVHGPQPGRKRDLLLSTAGRGYRSRHLPLPRRTFDAAYGSIFAYRAGHRRVYLAAVPDAGGPPLGADLDSVREGTRLLLVAVADAGCQPFARITLTRSLPPHIDGELAFDPIRHTLPGLHPIGLVHATRAWAYPLSQRWRGARTAAADPAAVRRALARR